jgi:chromosome segregation ATPase
MVYRKTEPVKHTCPDINRMIITITDIVKQMNSCNSEDEKETLLEQITDWKHDLECIGVGNRCDLEDLRSSNSALRDWGQEMYNDAEERENERDKYEEECESLKDEISDLEKENSKLIDKIDELQSVTWYSI